MMRCQSWLIALLLATTMSCIHVGQRLLTLQIDLDGQTVLEGICGVPDTMPVDTMWDVLADVAFTAKGAPPQFNELKGDVVIRIKHVDRELASVKLKSLSLQPDAAGTRWMLGKGELKRIQDAISK